MRRFLILLTALLCLASVFPSPAQGISSGEICFRISDGVGEPGSEASISLEISNAENLLAADVTITYPAETVTAVSVAKTGFTNNMSLVSNLASPGLIRVAMAGANPVAGTGKLFRVTFELTGSAGQTANIELTRIVVNDVLYTSCIDNGSLRINRAPSASDGAVATKEDRLVKGILAGSDADLDPLTFTLVENGKKGSAVIDDPSTGAFTYTPNANEYGPDTFTFKVDDGMAESSAATVSVTIRAVNDPPTISRIPNQVLQRDTSKTVKLTVDDVEKAAGKLTVEAHSSNPDLLPDKRLVLDGTGRKRTLKLRPALGATGKAVVTVTVSDGKAAAEEKFTVTVMKPSRHSEENNPPEALAGPDQRLDEQDVATLDGSNSFHRRNAPLSYLWTQTSGPPVMLSDPYSVRPTFTPPDVGFTGTALTFQLAVTSGDGQTTEDSCIVNVTWHNEPPVARAGADQTVDQGAAVTLDAGGSSDSDNGIASYRWTQIDGPAVELDDPSSVHPTFKSPEVEPDGASLSFLLTVSDHGGLLAQDLCFVNATSFHDPPVAHAGRDKRGRAGETILLNGSRSADTEGGPLFYLWSQTSGPPVTLSDPSSPRPTLAVPESAQAGSVLTFKLIVGSASGLRSQDDCNVEVVR